MAISTPPDPQNTPFRPPPGPQKCQNPVNRLTPGGTPPLLARPPPIISVSTSVQKRALFDPKTYALFGPFLDTKTPIPPGKLTKGVKNRVRGPPQNTPKKGSISPCQNEFHYPPRGTFFGTTFLGGSAVSRYGMATFKKKGSKTPQKSVVKSGTDSSFSSSHFLTQKVHFSE